MPKCKSVCIAAVGWLALTGAASAMPFGQPGSHIDVQAGAGIRNAAWQCFQFGNCVWRPDSNYYPYYGYESPKRTHRKRAYR